MSKVKIGPKATILETQEETPWIKQDVRKLDLLMGKK